MGTLKSQFTKSNANFLALVVRTENEIEELDVDQLNTLRAALYVSTTDIDELSKYGKSAYPQDASQTTPMRRRMVEVMHSRIIPTERLVYSAKIWANWARISQGEQSFYGEMVDTVERMYHSVPNKATPTD
jgi:hypothetical protein